MNRAFLVLILIGVIGCNTSAKQDAKSTTESTELQKCKASLVEWDDLKAREAKEAKEAAARKAAAPLTRTIKVGNKTFNYTSKSLDILKITCENWTDSSVKCFFTYKVLVKDFWLNYMPIGKDGINMSSDASYIKDETAKVGDTARLYAYLPKNAVTINLTDR